MRNKKSEIDVLNLEWTSFPSRDRQMATLVCNYLRFKGYKVVEDSMFNGFDLIDVLKPKLLFITNTIGAKINLKLVKYAKSKNIKVVSLISEGNFKEDENSINQFLWGWNKEKILYEDIHLQWTERTRDLSIKKYPELAQKIKISGGVGFDTYRIARKPSKSELLTKYKKDGYNKIIGIGCWDFGLFQKKDTRNELITRKYNKDIRERFINDGEMFNNILLDVVGSNPEILFIIKEHPGRQLGVKSSAIVGLEKYSNTLIFKDEESIFTCLAVSDLWFVYESTTALEGWLLNVQTGLINPSGIDFPRDDVAKGSPNFPDAKSLNEAIEHFYSSGNLEGFNELNSERKRIIRQTIQWDDGLNHVRAGSWIIKLLNKEDTYSVNLSLSDKASIFMQRILLYLAKKLPLLAKYSTHTKKLIKRIAMFDASEMHQYANKRYCEQENFYNTQNLECYEK